MRPDWWSPQPADDDAVTLAASPTGSPEFRPEPVPAEVPGMFVEQSLESWSPRDLFAGLARAVRWTGTVIVRGMATP